MTATLFDHLEDAVAGRELAELTSPPPFVGCRAETLDALLPATRSDPFTWVPANVQFPAKSSATATPYDFYMFPWHKGVWAAFLDPAIREISLRWAAQHGGKTAFMTSVLAWHAAEDPAPMIWGTADERLLKRTFTQKLYPVLEASPATARLLPPPHQRKDDLLDLTDCLVYGAHSGAATTLGDISARIIFINEVDKWSRRSSIEGDPESLIAERKKAFGSTWKLIREGTPTETDISRIDAAIADSDDRTFRVPCPRCGAYQALIFEQIQMPHDLLGRLADKETCAAESWYACSKCGGRIDDHEKLASLHAGVWARRGEDVREDGTRHVTDAGACKVTSTHAGFSIWSGYNPTVTWGELAAEWARCQGDIGRIRNFVNGWLARSYAPKHRRTTEEMILAHRGLEAGRGFPPDTLPADAPPVVICLLCVDVQDDCLWYTVWAVCEYKRRYLLRYGQLPRRLDSIPGVARMGFRGPDGATFGVTHVLIDSGYGERTKEVYHFCAAHSYIPTKGEDSDRRVQPIRWTTLSEFEWVNLLLITVNIFKDAMLDTIGATGNLDDPECWRLHNSTGMDFARQLTAERRVTTRNNRGQPVHTWTRIRDDNHYWDLCIMTEAAVMACELEGADFTERGRRQ